MDQVGQVLRYAFDFGQRHAGILGQAGAAHHFGGGLLHGDDGLVGVGLDGAHQRLYLAGSR